MTYIKTLTAPLIIIAGLALLTACGGGATPAEETAVDCTETPFDSPDMCEDEKDTICQTYGTGAKGDASCTDRINTACVANPFVYDGCDTLDDAIRNNFCALPANIFAHAECMGVSNINDLRTTFCEMPTNRFNQGCIDNKLNDNGRTTFCKMRVNIFDHMECMDLGNINDLRDTYCSVTDIFHASCLDDSNGGKNARDTECQTHGTNVSAGGHSSCDGRIRTACIANPFKYKGCDTLDADKEDNIRTDFCEILPTNRFNAQCILRDIGDDDDRDDTCEMYGITSPGHASCDGGNNDIRTACVLNPFEYPGCDTLDADDDDNIRTRFCAKAAQLFNPTCITRKIGDHDDDRDTACLESREGFPADPSCRANRPEVIKTCTEDPFLLTTPGNTGCENLDTIVSIRDIHCGTSPNSAIDRCTVEYSDWVASFGVGNAPPTRPTTTGEQQNEFLNAGTEAVKDARAAFNEMEASQQQVVESTTLNFDGTISSTTATANSVSYFSANGTNKRYYYAGLDSRTDLGAPSFQKAGTATWDGNFGVTIGNTKTSSPFELEVTFGGAGNVAGSIEAFVVSGDNHFLLTGNYDEKGVISGTVNFGAFMAGTRTPTAPRADNGILTGLIGKQGAIGAFLSGTGDKDDITGGTSATAGFAGGFVANPFDGNVSYRDWAIAGQAPAATANTANPQNQLLQTTRNDLNIGTITGAVHVNLATATYEDVALDGPATNGFTTGYVSTGDNYYAGITSTTNLGVALERTTGTGAWKGSFVVYEGGAATTTDFELMIEFAATNRVSATIGDYVINGTDVASGGTFTTQIALTRQGVLNGSGTLSGIIGQKGAVGVFRSDMGTDVSYAGGFVAAPPAFDGRVTYADWVDSFSPALASTPTAGTSAFLQATGSTLPTVGLRTANNVGSIIPSTLNLSTAEYENNPLGGDAEDGMAFFQGYSDSTPSAFYAGIFDTTNLGPPITASDASATWNGQFRAISTTEFNKSFTLDVIFGGQTNAAGSIEALVSTDATFSYFVKGTFSDRGVITGTIDFGLTPTGNEQRVGGVPGVLTGLIGQEGAVGAFHSTTVYGGGFVARPTR